MITLYGKQYAKNDDEFVNSLFTAGGTCNGYYKKTARGIYLYSAQKTLRAFIRRDGLGPVTATSHGRGRVQYMFTVATDDETWLGIPDSYMDECNGARALAREFFPAI